MEQAKEPLLHIDNVSRFFSQKSGFFGNVRQVRAVEGVSLALNRGETLGLVGESGSGKSTVARMAVRLLAPSAGDVRLGGQSIFNTDKAFQATLPGRLQMIFQDPYSSLNPRMRVGGSIGESLACAGMPAGLRREKVATLLEMVGLEPEHARRFPHEFSGGQRQRMAVARALAPEPDIIVCDEPVSSLDASVQAQVLNLLKDTQERLGLSYLFISHDLAVVSHMSDRVAVMYSGMIMEVGAAADIFANPLHPYTRLLLEASGVQSGHGASRADTALADAGANGCPFLKRCTEAIDHCRVALPELEEFNSGHFARCFCAGDF
ncbi:ATP-binding cassette domain-containing protein [Desulfovibrio sp. OttesenSCG-928-C06]|nr:ATP-binding cassette domain-containing protein [Desulfovibrio sp. OttesenSCG-928-C06]